MKRSYEQLRADIEGPVFSLMTPFREDESIDYPTLGKYIERIYEAGGRIFYAMAYNSRYSQLADEEILDLNSFVIKQVKGLDPANICIVGEPIHCSTRRTCEFAQHAYGAGADLLSVLCREKLFFEEQIVAHHQRVAEASPIGLLIHEMPFLSGMNGKNINWPISLLDKVAAIESVCAIKEDAKEDDYTREAVATVKDRLAIILSGGGKRQWLRFADQGARAWLNGIGVFEPKLAVIFHEAIKAKDQAMVDRILDEIEVPFFEHGVKKYGWHLTIKAAMESRGVMQRTERMPLMALPDAEYQNVAQVMASLPIDDIIAAAKK